MARWASGCGPTRPAVAAVSFQAECCNTTSPHRLRPAPGVRRAASPPARYRHEDGWWKTARLPWPNGPARPQTVCAGWCPQPRITLAAALTLLVQILLSLRTVPKYSRVRRQVQDTSTPRFMPLWPLRLGKEQNMAETQTCPACKMPKSTWKERQGQGYIKDGHTYCCRGCAEGTGCTCR